MDLVLARFLKQSAYSIGFPAALLKRTTPVSSTKKVLTPVMFGTKGVAESVY